MLLNTSQGKCSARTLFSLRHPSSLQMTPSEPHLQSSWVGSGHLFFTSHTTLQVLTQDLKEFFEIATLPVAVFCKWNRGKGMDSLSSRAYLTMTLGPGMMSDTSYSGLPLEGGKYLKLLCHQFDVPKINSREQESFMKHSLTLISSPTKHRFNPL